MSFENSTAVEASDGRLWFTTWGQRSAVIREEQARLTQAEENVQRVTRRVTLQVEKSYRNLELRSVHCGRRLDFRRLEGEGGGGHRRGFEINWRGRAPCCIKILQKSKEAS